MAAIAAERRRFWQPTPARDRVAPAPPAVVLAPRRHVPHLEDLLVGVVQHALTADLDAEPGLPGPVGSEDRILRVLVGAVLELRDAARLGQQHVVDEELAGAPDVHDTRSGRARRR